MSSIRSVTLSVLVLLLFAAATGCGSKAHPPPNEPTQGVSPTGDVLASAPISAETGGQVSADGVVLEVPAGALSVDGVGVIRDQGEGVYDISVTGELNDVVYVTLPLVDEYDVVIHQVKGEWVVESGEPGEATVTVSHLSPFSTLSNWAKRAACLKDWNPIRIIECLISKGIARVSADFVKWLLSLAPGTSDACVQQILEAGGVLSTIGAAFSGECVPRAGEGDWTFPATPTTSTGPAQTSAAHPRIELAQGDPAPDGWWYSVTLSGFTPGSSVTVSCHDSVDRNFWTQTLTIGPDGRASDSTLCYSADGPDHWVTGGGVESNHVAW